MKQFLIHQDTWTSAQLKGKSNEEIERLYYLAYKKVQHFVPIGEEEEDIGTKRAGSTLTSESSKKQKTMSDEQLNEMMMVVPEALNIDPIQAKHPIVDQKYIQISLENVGKQ